MTSAILWMLVFYPPNGDSVPFPFGYTTKKLCDTEGENKAKFSEEHGMGIHKWKCYPSHKAITAETYLRKTK